MAEKQGHLKRDDLEVFQTQFIGSFPDLATCPEASDWEVAFVGRSNVGKSSLINMLTGRKDLAKTSQNPGKTRGINLFAISTKKDKKSLNWTLVDLPGFGYAKFSRTERKKWVGRIRTYLEGREKLLCTFFLIDSRHDLQAIDQEWLEWFGEQGIPFILVFTKADKLSKNALKAQLSNLNSKLSEQWEPLPESYVSSSEKGRGRFEILERVWALVEGAQG
jgi:GTP-binding protein